MCMMAIAPVMSLVGGVVQGIGAKAKANQDAENYKAQANMQKRQAGVVQTTGAYKAQRQQDNVARALGAQRAAYAGSGVALSGTPLDTIEESATEGALDVAAIRWNTDAEATTQRYNASTSMASAKAAKKAGNVAMLSPIIGGVASFASGFGK
jgi:hypothetical protein